MYEYTIPAVLSSVAVVVLERRVLRTGLFRSPSYWWTMGISFVFMIGVDGWLTKLSAPIVRYDPDQKTPWRFPWDIPIEDFFFGFTMLTFALLLWVRLDTPADPAPWRPDREAEA
jgi:lycopene cyclase domain-containing protein